MSSREAILNKLRSVPRPFADVLPSKEYLPVVPNSGDLVHQFTTQAKRLGAQVYLRSADQEALSIIAALLGDDQCVMMWDSAAIPLPTLPALLDGKSIARADTRDQTVRVGLTGVTAALASTGSLVMQTGAGMPRTASLLPPLHIAVVQSTQILPSLEAWVGSQRVDGLARFRAASSAIVISGPSRTADIAMQLIMGMHGPEELHIILLQS